MFRRKLAVFLCAALVSCAALAASLPVGTVDATSHATLSGVPAEPGATVFSGDTLAVPPGGSASVNLNGGSHFALSASSQVVLLKGSRDITVEVQKGGALLTLPSGSYVRGLIGDASFTPSGSGPFTGIVGFTPSGRIVLFAEKGTWIATTEHDGRRLTLHPGEKLEGELRATQTAGEGETPEQANKKKKNRKKAVYWIGSLAAGTATGFGLAFGQSECTSPVQGSSCGGVPVASPIIP